MENKLSSIFVLIFILFIAGLSYWLSHEVNKELTDDQKNTSSAADFYLKNFNSTIVADFILSKTLYYKSKFKFIWNR